jgi:hypothetical protein
MIPCTELTSLLRQEILYITTPTTPKSMVITYPEHSVTQERGIFALSDCDNRDGDHRHSHRQRHSHVLQTQHPFQFKMLDYSQVKGINWELYILYCSLSIAEIIFNLHSGGWSPNWVHSARRPVTGLLYLRIAEMIK